jgi:hypothetical protein
VKKLKKILVATVALALAAGFAAVSLAGIEGSAHDLSGLQAAGGQICIVCHVPHNALSDAAPLWNHELSTATYTPYSSPSLDATDVGQPNGSAKLCLSCHDGTVAIDAFGGNEGTFKFPPNNPNNLGTDLSDDHPISFTYNDQLAINDGGLFEPTTTVRTIGSGQFTKTGPITDVLLEGQQLQCSACHSVHNDFVAVDPLSRDKLLKISIDTSDLCFACHNK